tara:strand:- start:17 stop:595 length:579 start_codon:yes stop_codon:yes gene_type:complete
MAKRVIKKDVVKKKKKRWFDIVSPKEFGSVVLGETLAEKPEDLIGRTLRLGFGEIMRTGRRSNYGLVFEVIKINEGRAITHVKSFGLVSSYVKRSGGKSKVKIEDSFLGETKDKVKVRIKPLLLTKFVVQGGVERDIRRKTKEYLLEIIKKEDYSVLVSKLVNSELQKKMRGILGKVYPLSISEIRVFKRVK